MANQVVGFTINIEGIDTISQLNAEIKNTEKALEGLKVGTEEYAQASEKLAKLKAEQKAVRKNQDDLNKSFLEQSDALGSYDKASAKLNRLRKDYKNLAIEGKEATAEGKALKKQIDELDATLKKVDGSVGQFQRNVGNYPKVFNLAGRGLRRYAGVLEDSEGKLGAFGIAAIGAFAAFKAGSAIVKAIGDLNEFNKELEATQQQLKALTGASGEELNALNVDVSALAKTFNVDSKSIIDSAKQISEKTGVSFGEAIKQIENGLLKGNESSQEFLTNIGEFPEAYKDVASASGQFADKQRELLETNKELADSQIEQAQKFAEFGATAEKLGNNVKTFLIDTFLFLYDNVLKPLYDNSIKPLIDAFSELFSTLGTNVSIFDILGTALNFVLSPAKLLYSVLTSIVTTLTNIIKVGKQAGEFLGVFSKQTGDASKSAGDFAKAQADNLNKIAEMQKKVADAESKRAKAEQDAINKRKKQAEEQKKIDDEAKKRSEEAKKKADELSKAKTKFQEEETKFLESSAKLNQSILEKTNKVITDLIANEFEKRRIIAQQNAQNEIKDIESSIDEQKKANQVRLDEAEKLYTKESEEYKKLKSNLENQEAISQEKLKEFKIQKTKEVNAEIKDINENEVKVNADINKKVFDQTIKNEQDIAQRQIQLKEIYYTEQIAKLDKNKKDEADKILELEKQLNNEISNITINRLQKEQQLIQDRLKNTANLTTEEQAELNNQLISLKAEEVKLFADGEQKKRDETAKTTSTIQENANKQYESFNKTIQQIGSFAQQSLDIFNSFLEAESQKQQQALDDSIERSQERQSQLEEEAQNSTGLRARELQQQAEQEIKVQKQLEKEKAKLEQEAKERNKAFAIINSIINTALAVTSALATPPAPNIVGAVLAGVLGAAQTALIAAQPLATGGIVGKLGDSIVQFAGGGKVTSKGNIKPLSNGDNVLATLKTGEVVLNRDQQNRIGYKALKNARIPGFAQGGYVGSPTTLIQSANTTLAEEKSRLNVMEELVSSTNNRIDRIQVMYTSSTDYDVRQGRSDRESIIANATF